jgi:hypothetical protein
MDRTRKLALIQRALGLKHKIKVHDSMPLPDSHEEIALAQVSRWELEDELHAIEAILADARAESVEEKRALIAQKGPKKKSKKP